MGNKLSYLTRPYENSLNSYFHFVLCLFSDTEYTRDHHTHLGLPLGEDYHGHKTINWKIAEHHSSVSLSWTMAYWSVFQISCFLDFIRPPQNASWLYFYPTPWWETKSETLLTYSLHLSPETMYILLIPYIKVPGIKSILTFVWKLHGMSDKSCNSLYKVKNQTFW